MVKFKYEDKEYLLEFDRASVEVLEKMGFRLNDFTDKFATMQPLLLRGAFIKNHKYEKGLNYDKMWAAVKNQEGLVNALLNMVADTYQTLMNNDDEGNENWEVI